MCHKKDTNKDFIEIKKMQGWQWQTKYTYKPLQLAPYIVTHNPTLSHITIPTEVHVAASLTC